MKKNAIFVMLVAYFLMLLMTACEREAIPVDVKETAVPQPTAEEAYPPSQTTPERDASNEAYPPPQTTEEGTSSEAYPSSQAPAEGNVNGAGYPPPTDTVSVSEVTETATVTPVPIEPESGKSTLIGQTISVETTKPLTQTTVMLAKVFREGGEGGFVLDTAHSPSTISDQEGHFVLANFEAAEYVIVVGDVFSEYAIITNPSTGKPATWIIEPDQVLDVGEQQVDFSKNQE